MIPRKLLLALPLILAACGGAPETSTGSVAQDIAEAVNETSESTDSSATECTIETVIDEYGFEVEVSSCDTNETAGDTAESTDSSATECTIETVIDEYGFEVEVSSCDTNETAQPSVDLDAVLASIPDEILRSRATEVIALADQASAACTDEAAWTAATNAAAADTLAFANLADQTGSSWLGSDSANALSDVIRNRLVLQPGCQGGFAESPSPASLSAAAAAARANDTLNAVLDASLTLETSSDFWYHSDQMGHVAQLADDVATSQGPEVLIFGSSVAKRSINPNTLGDALGVNVYNAAVAGLFSEVAADWWRTIIELDVQPSTVVIGRAAFEDFLQCNSSRVDAMSLAREFRNSAFREIEAFDAMSSAEVVAGTETANAGSVLSAYLANFDARGAIETRDVVNLERLATDTERYADILAQPTICDQRQADFIALVDSVLGSPSVETVIVFDAPLHPDLISLHPQAEVGFDGSATSMVDSLDERDVIYVDARYALNESQFSDLTHANGPGSDAITKILTDTFASLG